MDVVAANLNAEALLSLGPELTRVLAVGGRLILSGFRPKFEECTSNSAGSVAVSAQMVFGWCSDH